MSLLGTYHSNDPINERDKHLKINIPQNESIRWLTFEGFATFKFHYGPKYEAKVRAPKDFMMLDPRIH